MRQSGLESGGEFSVENIVFKVLRRNGMLDRLYDIKTVAYDKSVTLESTKLGNLTESIIDDSLGWIRDIEAKTPINNLSKYSIVLDYFNSLPRELKEGKWIYYIGSHSGSVIWESAEEGLVFYATPYWEEEERLPIDSEVHDRVIDLPLQNFEFVEDLINWLDNKYPTIVREAIESFMDHTNFLEEKSGLLELFGKKK